jgi:hypothetical protein
MNAYSIIAGLSILLIHWHSKSKAEHLDINSQKFALPE